MMFGSIFGSMIVVVVIGVACFLAGARVYRAEYFTKTRGREDASTYQRKKSHLLTGLILFTLGFIFILDRLSLIDVYTSWPLILVAIGLGIYVINRRTFAGWIVGGIGVIFFVVSMAPEFFGFNYWDRMVPPILVLIVLALNGAWPIISIIVGILLLRRYYYTEEEPQPKTLTTVKSGKDERHSTTEGS